MIAHFLSQLLPVKSRVIKNLTLFLTVFLVFFSCGTNAQSNEDEIIHNTIDKLLVAIRSGDEESFEKFIGLPLSVIGKDHESINFDFKRVNTFFVRYLTGGNIQTDFVKGYTRLGQRSVIIPIFNRKDTLNNIAKVELYFYFGPPRFVPLTQISDYKLHVQREHDIQIIAPPPFRKSRL